MQEGYPSIVSYLPDNCMAVPSVGSDLLEVAALSKIPVDSLLEKLLFQRELPLVPLTISPGVRENFVWVGGHSLAGWGPGFFGPTRPRAAMMIGKCLGAAETDRRALFVGSSGKLVRQVIRESGLRDDLYDEIYLSSLLKTRPLIDRKFLKGWLNQQIALLVIEMLLTRPKYVLAFGAEVLDFLSGKMKLKLSSSAGRWFEVTWKLREPLSDLDSEASYTFKVLPCLNPAALEYEQAPEVMARFQQIISDFVAEVHRYHGYGDQNLAFVPVDQRLPVTNYVEVRDLQALRRVLDRMAVECETKVVSNDAEWQGAHPQNRDAYLRCIQFCWKAHEAFVLEVCDTNGQITFSECPGGVPTDEALQKAFRMIEEAFAVNKWRLAGFYFGADFEWELYYGLDLSPFFEPADSCELAKTQGGLAVESMLAAYDELSDNDLEVVRWRFSDVEPYNFPFEQYKKEAAALKQIPLTVQKAGYGWIPNDKLYPYAAADVDVTWQGAMWFVENLHADSFGNDCWLPYWRAHRAALTVAEIMRLGMPFDRERCVEISLIYHGAVERLKEKIRASLGWPNFSVDTWQALAEVLYGDRYAPKRDAVGNRIAQRPSGAKTCNLEPLIDNDPKSPMLWEDVRRAGLENSKNPNTGLKAMGMMLNSSDGVAARRLVDGKWTVDNIPVPEIVQQLYNVKQLRQVQKMFVGVPIFDDVSGELRCSLAGGLLNEVCDDGFVRCFVSTTKETGRWSAARPNLHNLPKRKEQRYKKVLKDAYPGKIRSVFKAPPGYVIVESDYSSAELFMLAIASNDANLWDHCQRNLLPEEHPNHVDIHARLCVQGFKMQCTPNKAGLQTIGMGYLRDVAKCMAEGEWLHTSVGLIPVEQIGGLVAEGAHVRHVGDLEVQADFGKQPLVAIANCGVKPCVTIRSGRGFEITTTEDHRHYVISQNGLVDFKHVRDLQKGDAVLLNPTSFEDSIVIEFPGVLQNLREQWGQGFVISDSFAFMLGFASGLTDRQVRQAEKEFVLTVRKPSQVADLVQAIKQHSAALWGAGAVTVTQQAGDLEIRGVSLIDLVVAVDRVGWRTVPPAVGTWPFSCRAGYLSGFLLPRIFGSDRAPSVFVPADQAKSLQLLLLSLGVVVSRKSSLRVSEMRDLGGVVCEFTDQSDLLAQVLACMRKGDPSWWRFSSRVSAERGTRLPYILRWLDSVAVKHGWLSYADMSPSGWSSLRLVYERLHTIDKHKNKLSKEERQNFNRISDLVGAGLVADLIVAIEHVGPKKTYDFETTETRQRILFASGIATHNSVVYGWAYGRQERAIVIGAREEGIDITVDEASALTNALATEYPDAAAYLVASAARVADGFICTPMGRYRRCPVSQDRAKLAAYGREFKNAPVQGGVADVVNEAAYNLRKLRALSGLSFHIMMQIHDAFLFLCPYREVVRLCNDIIPKAMCDLVPIIPRRLDGSWIPGLSPKYMGCGINISFVWGSNASDDELREVGIEPTSINRLER